MNSGSIDSGFADWQGHSKNLNHQDRTPHDGFLRVLIADDHRLVRDGLQALISTSADMVVVGQAEDGRQALTYAKQLQPDVVLMDFAMPRLNGLGALRQIRAAGLNTQVIFLSAYGDDDRVQKVLQAGASGYILKDSPGHEVLNGIRHARQHSYYFSPAISSRLLVAFRHSVVSPGASESAKPKLTERENEILQLIAEGHLNKQIADELGICKKTVVTHRQALMKKLKLHNIASLTCHAVRQKIVLCGSDDDLGLLARSC
ncbi:MAG TPA: response regulator transcription factor [Candidatus Saccharimonadales bacterium]|nr:response regulator transcription factor [Candidatus Saccharimonadales bacterium]